MSIPVYGLSGIDGIEEINDIYSTLGDITLGANRYARPKNTGRSFNQYAAGIKDKRYRDAVVAKHREEISALNGVFETSWLRIRGGAASSEDFVNLKKVKILLTLNNTDYHGYRLAQIILPYAVDIDDNDGGYIFPTMELAQTAAQAEQRIIDYLNTPGANEVGFEEELGSLKSWFKKVGKAVGNATKAVGKAIVNSVVAPVKATVQATKATVNVVKAGVQAMTGNTAAAKESLKTAVQNVKSSIVDPVKTAYQDTVNVVKTNIVEPTVIAAQTTRDVVKATVQIAGKVFKVLFLKINPLTVLTRNALRGLISLNFIGMATRLNVGLLTEAQAAQLGYDRDTWQQAVTAIKRIKKLYEKMGGNTSKLLKSITNGAGKKPLFAKDIRPDSNINFANNEEEESSLAIEPATTAALLALCSTIITIIWQWIQHVVSKKEAAAAEAKAEEQAAEQQKKAAEQKAAMDAIYAHNNQGQYYTDENGNLITWEEWEALQAEGGNDGSTDDDKKKKILIASAAGLILIGGIWYANKNKHAKK